MGILVQTSFETPQGIPVQSVYVRITGLNYELVPKVAAFRFCAYLNRDKRMQGYSEITVPGMDTLMTVSSPSIPTLDALYWALKRRLTRMNFVVEDVLEDGQSTTEPPPEPEPSPEAPPQPMPGPAPAPAPEPAPEA